jgi:CheY-like chemotaxis protein
MQVESRVGGPLAPQFAASGSRANEGGHGTRESSPLSVHAAELALEKLKGQFLASLNHELRTPLSGVVGMTDLLLETNLDVDQREYVETTRECALQLLDTLNVVLTYSSLAAGQLKSEKSEFDIRQLLEGLAAEARSKCQAKGIEFRFTLDEELPETIHNDAHQFRETIAHLLSNAVKFTHRGWVEFRAAKEGLPDGRCNLLVTVEDTGVGIAPNQLARIWESFHQAESGLDRGFSGLGLGLALVDRLVRLMGGAIEVESQPGRGSMFRLRLALYDAPVETTRPSEIKTGAARRPAGDAVQASILLVEDNLIAQQVARHMLTKSGYWLDVAATGDQAIELAANNAYDLVIADIQLPGRDGFETADAIRGLSGLADLPIIGLSANDAPEIRNQAERHRFSEFLPKPIDRRVLLATVDRVLKRQTAGRSGSAVSRPA